MESARVFFVSCLGFHSPNKNLNNKNGFTNSSLKVHRRNLPQSRDQPPRLESHGRSQHWVLRTQRFLGSAALLKNHGFFSVEYPPAFQNLKLGKSSWIFTVPMSESPESKAFEKNACVPNKEVHLRLMSRIISSGTAIGTSKCSASANSRHKHSFLNSVCYFSSCIHLERRPGIDGFPPWLRGGSATNFWPWTSLGCLLAHFWFSSAPGSVYQKCDFWLLSLRRNAHSLLTWSIHAKEYAFLLRLCKTKDLLQPFCGFGRVREHPDPCSCNWPITEICRALRFSQVGPFWPRQSRPNLRKQRSKKWATNLVFWSPVIHWCIFVNRSAFLEEWGSIRIRGVPTRPYRSAIWISWKLHASGCSITCGIPRKSVR